jgi:rhamnulokinase
MNDVLRTRYDRSGEENTLGTKRDCGQRVRQKRPTLVAIDLGAESCRVSLLQWTDRQPKIRLVHRFPNSPRREGTSLRWDIACICKGVEEGLRACAQLAPEGVAAIGVDGWAVDYVRVGSDGEPIAQPYCYRDERTIEALKRVHFRISPERLYQLTGIQILALNTLYQLHADSDIEQSLPWTNLPEFLMQQLGGKRASEYTNATHTQLLSVRDQTWCPEIFEAAGLDLKAAPPVVRPGTDLGRVRGRLASLPQFRDTRLIAPACHDTASAIAGIPGEGDDWAFISSGTWSLVGCVLDSACISDAARRANFSNEGGVGGKIYFLKNVNGMWLLRQCLEQWRLQGQVWTLEGLVDACANLTAPACLIDVDEPELLLPGDVPARINVQLNRLAQASVPEGPGAPTRIANLIFHSLAARYAAVLKDLMSITGKTLKRVYVVGGGSKNTVLNRLTAKATGLEVLTGSTESTTIGNCAVQLAALDESYSDNIGVALDAVAMWARILATESIDEVEETIQAHKIEEARPTGKALA